MNETKALASTIATDSRVKNLVPLHSAGSVDWISIITQLLTTLVPLLIGCLGAATPKSYVEEHYDGQDYEPTLLRRTAFQAKRHARKQKVRLTESEAVEVALATLDKVRTGNDTQLSAVMTECSA